MLGETRGIYNARSIRSRTPAADSEVTEQQELDEVLLYLQTLLE